jgi:hypothetical protein
MSRSGWRNIITYKLAQIPTLGGPGVSELEPNALSTIAKANALYLAARCTADAARMQIQLREELVV